MTYSNCTTIEEYADALVNAEKIGTRIRIDVAHFEKKYKDLLKNLPRRIFTFYMASIGKLVMSQNVTEAGKIVETLLLISNCETDGKDEKTGLDTECFDKKEWLRKLITSKLIRSFHLKYSKIFNKLIPVNLNIIFYNFFFYHPNATGDTLTRIIISFK